MSIYQQTFPLINAKRHTIVRFTISDSSVVFIVKNIYNIITEVYHIACCDELLLVVAIIILLYILLSLLVVVSIILWHTIKIFVVAAAHCTSACVTYKCRPSSHDPK